jgi:uncharacterized repeat protein (TIGR03847 family)
VAGVELEFDSVDFVTIGTVGPKGRRQFYIQLGAKGEIITLTIEKEQARELARSLSEMLDDILRRNPALPGDASDMSASNMELRDPIEPRFRVGQIGIAYSPERDMVIVEALEVAGLSSIFRDESQPSDDTEPEDQPNVVRFWVSRVQLRAVCIHAMNVVRQGRVDPQNNGRMMYYWT